jgi:hypothetical protein
MLNKKLIKIISLIVLLTGFNAHSQDAQVEDLTKLSDEYLRNSDLFLRAHSGKNFVIRGLLSSYTTVNMGNSEHVIAVVAPSRELKFHFSLVCPLGNLADRNYLDKLVVGSDVVVLSGTFAKDLASKSMYATLGNGITVDGVDCRVRN